MAFFRTSPVQLAGAAMLASGLLLAAAHPAAAESMKECGAAYKAAKAAGTLNGADWKTFRATQCSSKASEAAAAPAATPMAAAPVAGTPVPAAGVPAATTAPGKTAPAPVVAAAPATAPAPAGNAVFPDKLDPKYATLKGGKARMKTCDEQYQANKATGGNAGMKWIEKGGGYYSACSKHLKAI